MHLESVRNFRIDIFLIWNYSHLESVQNLGIDDLCIFFFQVMLTGLVVLWLALG
jgi:hypothetical protein